jgi:hypothetical protein
MLIDAVDERLSGWQANKLSIAGRIVLLNSVMSAILIYFMSMVLLPKWVIKAIDNIRRSFLWYGHKKGQVDKKSMCLIN